MEKSDRKTFVIIDSDKNKALKSAGIVKSKLFMQSVMPLELQGLLPFDLGSNVCLGMDHLVF